MTSRAPGLRERKKTRTREKLAAAAFRLVEERGFEAITVDEIAAAADVSRSTFFRYFPSKEAVLFPWREDVLALLERELSRRERGESAFQAVRRSCIAMGEVYQRDRDFVVRHQAVVEASPAHVAYELELARRLEGAIADALVVRSPRGLRAQRRARLLAGATHGVLRATVREWMAKGGRPDLLRLGTEALDLLENFTDLSVPESGARGGLRR